MQHVRFVVQLLVVVAVVQLIAQEAGAIVVVRAVKSVVNAVRAVPIAVLR